jgi:site-specific recombinase XerD
VPIAEVHVQDIDHFIEYSQEQGHAIATINRRIAALCSFYRFLAMMSDDAPVNPIHLRRHSIQSGRRLPRDVKDEDLVRLFSVIDFRRDRAMFLLMLRCGLRVGEVRNLSLNDLYLYSITGGLPRLWLRGKGSKERVAYLSSEAMSALEAWLEIRANGKDQAVFLNRSGKQLTITGIQLQLASYCQLAGVWVTCHQLRHTFGRHLVEMRVPVTTIQKLMGHTRLRTTEVYLHISDQQVQADYEAAMEQIMERFSLMECTP